MREMKWYIFNSQDETIPLCWGNKCLEFDTEKDATKFFESIPRSLRRNAIIKECIMYYDGGYFNASGYTRDSLDDAVFEKHIEAFGILHDAFQNKHPLYQLVLDDYGELIGKVTF